MQEHPETETLAQFVETRSDAAFERLVAQHLDMVFGCAMRRCGDRQLAEEISQNVFAILARKAKRLKAGSGLAGWLHKTTLYETKKALRGESRRNRKMKALAEDQLSKKQDHDSTDKVLPQLDEAIDELPEADRQLLLLRFFEGKNFQEIAVSIGKSEAAAQKQASRAVEKLGRVLKRRGVVAGTAALGTILAAESAKAAPIGIASSISTSAFASASTLSTTTLVTNAIQTMTYAKTKIAIFTAAAAAVPLGAQWNTIDNLKEDAEKFREREVEFVQQGERLAKLEKQIASMPEGLQTNFGKNQSAQMRPDRISAINQRTNSASTKKNRPGASQQTNENAEDPFEKLLANATENLDDMMKNPAMRALVKQQMAAQINASHGKFIKYVTDDEEKQDKIRKVLVDRMLGVIDVTDPNSEIASTDEDTYEKELQSLLGEQGWEEFQRYESSAAERQELTAFRGTLEESGLTLAFETEQQLMTIMFEEKEVHDVTEFITADTDDLEPSDKTMQQMAKSSRALAAKVSDRARAILTPAQLEIFEKNQASHIEMLESSFETGRSLMSEDE